MKITVFQSDKGDCLLITSADGRHMLVDGGMSAAYTRHVSPTLAQMGKNKEELDLVYVSHIDEDHISGVLRMLDDLVAWRVHDFQKKDGNTRHKEPKSNRPPEIKEIWHNAFHEQVRDNSGEIADLLAASATILSAATSKRVLERATQRRELAASVKQAIQLSRRIGDQQLKIKLNDQFGRKLIMIRDNQPKAQVGSMELFVIGPFKTDLDKLRKDWKEWLETHAEELRKIADQASADAEHLTNEVQRITQPLAAQAEDLGRLLPPITRVKKLGERENVTVPNLASLMLLVEEAGKTLLLTGDGHADDILKGLKHCGKLDGAGRIHVDVLKVQHHGSEHNLHEPFCRAVTADHYIFCANGKHENPDLEVVKAIVNERIKGNDGRPFKLWFNSHSSVIDNENASTHMKAVESKVKELAQQSNGRITFEFLKGDKFELVIN